MRPFKTSPLVVMMWFVTVMVVVYMGIVGGMLQTTGGKKLDVVVKPGGTVYPRGVVTVDELPAEGVACVFNDAKVVKRDSGDDNTAGLTEGDRARWVGRRLYPLSKEPHPEGSRDTDEMWRLLAPWLQVGENYPDPILVEVVPKPGTSLGRYYARYHGNASVVSLVKHGRAAAESTSLPVEPNFLRVILPEKPVKYEPLFSSCHIFNAVLLMGGWEDVQGPSLPRKILNLTRVLYVEKEKGKTTGLEDIPHITQTVIIETETTEVYRVLVGKMVRGCRKTWVAPEVQWGRSTVLEYDGASGVVSFRVESKKKRLGRVIHPMAFVPHINMETLLALGLTEGQRLRLLGEQIGTPRYPDPMPHNWIWSGTLKRIDKIDLRYETEVNETATYWGTSTLGYLTLLTDNLCLPHLPSGFPHVPSRCLAPCTCCTKTCSYSPICSPPSPHCIWNQPVCPQCLKCSECLKTIGISGLAKQLQCPFDKYTSWSKASKVWNKWKKKAEEVKQEEDWWGTRC